MSAFKRTLNYFIVSSIVYRIPVAYFADLPRLVIVHKIVHARARHVARTDDEFQCRYESVSFAVALVAASPARSPLPHTSHVACRCSVHWASCAETDEPIKMPFDPQIPTEMGTSEGDMPAHWKV